MFVAQAALKNAGFSKKSTWLLLVKPLHSLLLNNTKQQQQWFCVEECFWLLGNGPADQEKIFEAANCFATIWKCDGHKTHVRGGQSKIASPTNKQAMYIVTKNSAIDIILPKGCPPMSICNLSKDRTVRHVVSNYRWTLNHLVSSLMERRRRNVWMYLFAR